MEVVATPKMVLLLVFMLKDEPKYREAQDRKTTKNEYKVSPIRKCRLCLKRVISISGLLGRG